MFEKSKWPKGYGKDGMFLCHSLSSGEEGALWYFVNASIILLNTDFCLSTFSLMHLMKLDALLKRRINWSLSLHVCTYLLFVAKFATNRTQYNQWLCNIRIGRSQRMPRKSTQKPNRRTFTNSQNSNKKYYNETDTVLSIFFILLLLLSSNSLYWNLDSTKLEQTASANNESESAFQHQCRFSLLCRFCGNSNRDGTTQAIPPRSCAETSKSFEWPYLL